MFDKSVGSYHTTHENIKAKTCGWINMFISLKKIHWVELYQSKIADRYHVLSLFSIDFFSYKVFLTRLLKLWAIIVNEYHMYVLINPAPSNTNIDSVFVTIPPTTYIFGALILRFLFLFHFSICSLFFLLFFNTVFWVVVVVFWKLFLLFFLKRGIVNFAFVFEFTFQMFKLFNQLSICT